MDISWPLVVYHHFEKHPAVMMEVLLTTMQHLALVDIVVFFLVVLAYIAYFVVVYNRHIIQLKVFHQLQYILQQSSCRH